MPDKIDIGYYQHKYGGLYYIDKDCIVKNTVDSSTCIVYTHVYPFEKQRYVRLLSEFFDGRFTLISNEDAGILLCKNNIEFQKSIIKNKEIY